MQNLHICIAYFAKKSYSAPDSPNEHRRVTIFLFRHPVIETVPGNPVYIVIHLPCDRRT